MAISDQMMEAELRARLFLEQPSPDLWTRVQKELRRSARNDRVRQGAATFCLLMVAFLGLVSLAPSGRMMLKTAVSDTVQAVQKWFVRNGDVGIGHLTAQQLEEADKRSKGVVPDPDYQSMPLNDELEVPLPGAPAGTRRTITAVTLETVREMEPAWPMPEGLRLADGAKRVELTRMYEATGKLRSASIFLTYTTESGAQVEYRLQRLEYDRKRPPDGAPGLVLQYNADEYPNAKWESVTVLGTPTMALSVDGKRWQLIWTADRYFLSLMGDLPLEELVKIADSVPGLKGTE